MDRFQNLWAGKIKTTGKIVVYDPELQLQENSNIYVYSLSRNVVRQFDKTELRSMVSTIYGKAQEEAFNSYLKWKNKNFTKFIATEPSRLLEEDARIKIAEDRIKENYKRKLIEHGINPETHQIQKVSPRAHRTTHCYDCKKPLDNKLFYECISCKWIICACGACGCGYSKKY